MSPPASFVHMRRIRLIAVVVAAALAAACATQFPLGPVPPSTSTFAKLLEQAESGDLPSQNVVANMLLIGQGAPTDSEAAFRWFGAAADSGYMVAQVNLAILHYLGVGAPRDRVEAERLFRVASANTARPLHLRLTSLADLVDGSCGAPSPTDGVGRDAFRIFCAGCHGINGIAAYGLAPSFALGERMEKETTELLSTVLSGHGSMPAWNDKLPPELLERALEYARSLEGEFRWGIVHTVEELPDLYFTFGAMSEDFGNRPAEMPISNGSGEPSFGEFCRGV